VRMVYLSIVLRTLITTPKHCHNFAVRAVEYTQTISMSVHYVINNLRVATIQSQTQKFQFPVSSNNIAEVRPSHLASANGKRELTCSEM